MREPKEVVAAINIVGAIRGALADQFAGHKATGWDDDILMTELARILGAILRLQDARPSVVERLVESVRLVHAGLKSQHMPDAEEAVRAFCPERTAEATKGHAAEGSPTVQ